jgi:hypothetical protein
MLYAAFLDLNKAYDSVHRSRLWEAMHDMHIPEHMIHLIASVYEGTHCSLKLHGIISTDKLWVSKGVRQGCPLSPLLFNLCLARLPHHLDTFAPDGGVQLQVMPPAATAPQPVRISCIIYADDIVLLATSPEALQAMLQQAATYTAPFGLRFSADKSHVVCFHRRNASVPAFKCSVDYNPIPVVDNVAFLGIAFHSTQGHAFGLKQRALYAKRAAENNINYNYIIFECGMVETGGHRKAAVLMLCCYRYCKCICTNCSLNPMSEFRGHGHVFACLL